MKKIFITGGSGFIGSHLINCLSSDYKLFCLKRIDSKPRIPLNTEPEWIEGSIDGDHSSVLKECEFLIHLAAHSPNFPYDNIENCLYWNLTSSLKLLQDAKRAGIKKFIIIGTGFEYGRAGEECEFITEETPLKPTMTYSASKAASSIIFYQWAIENNLKLQYLRIFQVFGEGEDASRLWPSMKIAAENGDDFILTKGEQVRDFTSIEYIVKELKNSLIFNKVKSGIPIIRNLSWGKPQTLKEFSTYWWKKWNASGKLIFGEKPYRENEVMRFVPKKNK